MESLNACLRLPSQKLRDIGVEHGSRKQITNQVVKASPIDVSIQEETIKKELLKEKEKLAQQAEAVAAEKLRANEKARREMREWWTQKWEAKKRSEGWGGNEKCWLLKAVDTAQNCSVLISGEGILVGAAPVVSGSIKPFVVDFPMISSIHAHVYGKDVVKSYKNYKREYFVVDLGSTNGTYLNRSKLRPRTEVKLSSGDILKFGDEKATFVVESQK